MWLLPQRLCILNQKNAECRLNTQLQQIWWASAGQKGSELTTSDRQISHLVWTTLWSLLYWPKMRDRDLGPLDWEEKKQQKQVGTAIKTCRLFRFKELSSAMKIFIIPAMVILRTTLSLHIDIRVLAWKVKAAISNQGDSCRCFCVITQRIQVRLRPPWGTEEQEILFITSVLPLWRLGTCRRWHPGWLSGQQNGWRGNPALQPAVSPVGFLFFQERDTTSLSHFSTSLLRARNHSSILKGNSWCLIKCIFFLLFVLILTQLCHIPLLSSL